MIGIAEIGEIVAQYEKHGWKIRRALLSPASSIGTELDPSIEVFESDIDALWFSRPSKTGRETWELRRLAGSPFALVAIIESDMADDENEAILRQVEQDMRERTIA